MPNHNAPRQKTDVNDPVTGDSARALAAVSNLPASFVAPGANDGRTASFDCRPAGTMRIAGHVEVPGAALTSIRATVEVTVDGGANWIREHVQVWDNTNQWLENIQLVEYYDPTNYLSATDFWVTFEWAPTADGQARVQWMIEDGDAATQVTTYVKGGI